MFRVNGTGHVDRLRGSNAKLTNETRPGEKGAELELTNELRPEGKGAEQTTGPRRSA